MQEVRDLYRRLLDLKAWVDDVREAANRKNTLEELQALVGRLGALPVRFYEYNKASRGMHSSLPPRVHCQLAMTRSMPFAP